MLVVGWTPPPGSTGIPTDTTVRVSFSGYPDPDTVSVSSMLLTSGFFRTPQSYRVDLLTRSVTMTSISGLTSNLGYAVTVSNVIRSLQGCSGPTTHSNFITGDGPAGTTQAVAPTFADIAPILTSRCAGGCHAAPDGTCLDAPTAGLSLCLDQAREALVDAPSSQLAGIALVAPFDAARSYLIRKVIPAPPDGGPIPGTFGQREPPGAPLSDDQIRTLSDWIDGGALP